MRKYIRVGVVFESEEDYKHFYSSMGFNDTTISYDADSVYYFDDLTKENGYTIEVVEGLHIQCIEYNLFKELYPSCNIIVYER